MKKQNLIIMKQPELGRKISELRKLKGLTQEELVEKCNISVRTIQRVEAGEVTPRSYTVKTILAALDYDISQISDNDTSFSESFFIWIKNLLYTDIDTSRSSDYLIKQLNNAWIFGVIYFTLGFFEGAADYFRHEQHRLIIHESIYVVIKAGVVISFIFFQRGFILIGHLFQNYLLKVTSVILIFGISILCFYDAASVFYNSVEREWVMGGVALTFGAFGIIYGISLRRLNLIGKVAKTAGLFEILAGCFFLTIVLSFMGFIMLIPAEILEIIILFKAIELIRQKQTEIGIV